MSFPQTVRYSTFARLVFPVVMVSLLVIIFTVVMLDLVFTMSQGRNSELLAAAGHHQYEPSAAYRWQLNEEQIEALVVEKRVLQANFQECLADKNRELLETTKHLRDEIEKLNNKKNKEGGKCRHQQQQPSTNDSVTVSRDLFDYLVVHLRDAPYPGVDNYIKYKVAQMGLTPLADVEPLIPEFGPVINDVLSFKYPISVPPCRDREQISIDTIPSTAVFVVVISAIDNFQRRELIRQTWRNHLTEADREHRLGMAGFAFFISDDQTPNKETQQKIEQEAKTHGDIIQTAIGDDDSLLKRNDSSMKMAGLFNWLYKHCTKVDFVMKVDDDVYVNVRNLAHFIQSDEHKTLKQQSVFGIKSDAAISNHWPTVDDDERRHHNLLNVSFEDWPWNRHPPYLLGAIVLISGHSILPLLAACQTTPVIPFQQDLYWFGICTEKAGIELDYSSTGLTRFLRIGSSSKIETATTCELRLLIAWRVDYQNDFAKLQVAMNSYHEKVEHLNRNATAHTHQCSVHQTTWSIADESNANHLNL